MQSGLVIIYWTIGLYSKLSYVCSRLKSDFPAFIICSAIPQIQTIGGFVAAVAVMQFTFTFPPLLLLGYQVMTDAMTEDKAFSPGNGRKGRIDTWKDWSRWKRVKAFLRSFMLTALTSATGTLRWTVVFQNVQSNAWIGRPYDSLHGNVGRWFNNPGDVCHFRRSNIVWMYCTCVICT